MGLLNIHKIWQNVKVFCVGEPPPPRETKDASVIRIWEDYWGMHVAIDRGQDGGIERSDIFFVVHPKFKIEVTHPATGAVLTTYYKNAFKIRAERVRKDWTECDVMHDAINANSLPDDGNIAVFQYNFDRWAEKPRAAVSSLRLP